MKYIFTLLIVTLLFIKVNAQINPVGSYDSCGAALNLDVNATCITGGQTYMTTGATKSPQATLGISNDDDVWFKFTTLAGQTHASIQISNEIGGMGSCMELWDSCNASAEISDFCGSQFNVSGLTPLKTYLVRVYTNGTFSTLSSFQMCVVNTTPPPPPPNSECAFATSIQVSNNNAVCNLFPLTNNYATGSTIVSAPACLSSNYKDIWIKFVPSQTGPLSFRMQDYSAIAGSAFPTYYIATYSGTNCNSLSLVNCSNYSPTSGNDYSLSGTYNSGSTYYLRILCDNSIAGDFNVCLRPSVSETNYPISADSTCLRSIAINSSVDNSALYTQGSTNGIRRINQLACYGYNAPNALAWYSFTVPSNGNYFVDFTDLTRLDVNAFGAGYRVLRRATCYSTGTDTIITKPPNSTYDTLLCANSFDNGQMLTLTTGTQYYVTVMENSYNGGRVAYKLRVIGASTCVNDDSTNAINIIQDVNCNNAINTSLRFSTLSTQPNISGLTNNGSLIQDVWYKFNAITSSVIINVTLPLYSSRIVVYNSDGTIKYDPGTNGNIITVNSLVIGARYLIRVFNTNGLPIGPSADFKICVFGASPSVATSVSSCTPADATNISTNSNQWLHFQRSGGLIVSVFDGPAKPGFTFLPRGTISVSYFTNNGGIRLNAGTSYLDRNFEISDGGNNFSNSPVRVRFYLEPGEFNTLVASAASGGISAPYELKVYRIPGASCSNSTTAGGLYYNIDSYGFISNSTTPSTPTGYYVDMITPNFSGFFLQHAADNLLVPSTCNNFYYKIYNNSVQLFFSTLQENNNSYYQIERSENGENFVPITSFNSNNNINGSKYSYTDYTIKPNAFYYYRIKQVDKDNSYQFICKTILVSTKKVEKTFGKIYPNPVMESFNIDINKPFAGKALVQILNANGQIVYSSTLNISLSDQKLNIKTPFISRGVYTLKLLTDKGIEQMQFIKY